ncbi:MAG TPA: hypothetical protein PKE45_15960 [Caldilineaceae bacterium]|nr:hypothetical protein [Caldilineaceae bacterium]
MNSYSIALFLHIVSALGFFLALGLEWTGLWQLRNTMSLEQAHTWMSIFKSTRKVGFVAMLTTVITGIYMMVMYWGSQPWLIVTVGSLILVIVLAQAVTAPRMAAIGRALAMEKGAASKSWQNLANHPLLWVSIQARMAIALGIVFLKIAKPDLAGSLFAIGIAVVLGVASALPMSRRLRVQEGAAG